MSELLRTALYQTHQSLGARLVPFAGWEMPVQYAGVIAEVRAVRQGCGIFDVSHMGQFFIGGDSATTALNGIVSADWSDVPAGRAAYGLLLNKSGGIIDDVMGYCLREDEWLVVVNASRAPVDEAHFRAHLPGEVELVFNPQKRAMIAIQGPDAARVLAPLLDVDVNAMKWRDGKYCSMDRFCEIEGALGYVARGGYTGCDGFELMFDSMAAPQVWAALIKNGAVPCGLGARDVLRLEAGLPLYGHELRENWTPAQSGVGFVAKTDKSSFLGREALLEKGAPQSRVRALLMEGRAIPREGYRVLAHDDADANANAIGEITSGTMSVELNQGIALAMLPLDLELGDLVDVEIRGARHAAKIVKPPFVASGKK